MIARLLILSNRSEQAFREFNELLERLNFMSDRLREIDCRLLRSQRSIEDVKSKFAQQQRKVDHRVAQYREPAPASGAVFERSVTI